jgi:hypothetical protein
MKTKTLFTMIKLFSIAMMFASCISFENMTLDDKSTENKTVTGKVSAGNKIDLNANYSCVKDLPSLTMSGKILQVALKEAKGNCFGFYFDTKDISTTPIMKVRAKFTASAKVPSVDILAGFTDEKGGKTYYPEKSKIVKSGAECVDFYFDYTKENASNERHIDPTKIKSILIFVNILGVEGLSGNLQIEEVSLQAKM